MSESLLVAGIVCIVAAIVGGGVKLLGAEVPALGSFPRQALLFVVGLGFLATSFTVNRSASPAAGPSPAAAAGKPPANDAASAPASPADAPASAKKPESATANPPPGASADGPCPAASALDCLPPSSGPVSFSDPAAANQAAWRNLRDGLSTTEGEKRVLAQGATGKAARLCGILASDDSSPLGKHLAALRLRQSLPEDGRATAACITLASSFI